MEEGCLNMDSHVKVSKVIHYLAGLMFILAGIVLIGTYLIEDIYHVLKYGYVNYKWGIHIYKISCWIRPICLAGCGVLYITEKKQYLPIMLACILFSYRYVIRCLFTTTDFNMLKWEVIACLGLILVVCFDDDNYLSWMIVSTIEIRALLSLIPFLLEEKFFINKISGIAFSLYRIPFILALVLISLEKFLFFKKQTAVI